MHGLGVVAGSVGDAADAMTGTIGAGAHRGWILTGRARAVRLGCASDAAAAAPSTATGPGPATATTASPARAGWPDAAGESAPAATGA